MTPSSILAVGLQLVHLDQDMTPPANANLPKYKKENLTVIGRGAGVRPKQSLLAQGPESEIKHQQDAACSTSIPLSLS